MHPNLQEQIEELAWVNYLDNRDNGLKSPRLFELWKRLWLEMNKEVPEGAWT